MKTAVVFLIAAVLFTAPAFPQGSLVSEATDFVIFADFVIGSGWSFQLAVTNNSPTTAVNGFTVVLVDKNHPQAVSFQEGFESGSVPLFTIPPGGTKIYSEWPNVDADEVVRGGVLVAQLTKFPAFEGDTQMTSAVLTYRNDATGIEVTVPPLTVAALTPPFFNDEVAYSVFVEETDAVTTGLALWKDPANETCLALAGLDGSPYPDPEGHTLICYAPEYGDQWSHSVGLLPEWFPGWSFSEGFQGRLVVAVTDNEFGPKGNDGLAIPMGLRANRASGAISAVPVVPVATPFTPAKSSRSGQAFDKMSPEEHLRQRLGQIEDGFSPLGR
ncbi:MAG: hypothetical protein OXB98_04100 [Bryobacterales bacterium]|nr:hypothetical protein [Bryobacterales bacterium]